MTVQTDTPYTESNADGGTDQFPFVFKAPEVANIKVYINGLLTSSGVTVSCNPDQEVSPGGVVTINPMPEMGTLVRIERETPTTQGLDLQDYAPFPAASVEAALDRPMLLLQELVNRLRTRTIIVPDGGDQKLHVRVGDGQNSSGGLIVEVKPVPNRNTDEMYEECIFNLRHSDGSGYFRGVGEFTSVIEKSVSGNTDRRFVKMHLEGEDGGTDFVMACDLKTNDQEVRWDLNLGGGREGLFNLSQFIKMRLPHSGGPAAPQPGDLWFDGTDIKVRLDDGTTVTLASLAAAEDAAETAAAAAVAAAYPVKAVGHIVWAAGVPSIADQDGHILQVNKINNYTVDLIVPDLGVNYALAVPLVTEHTRVTDVGGTADYKCEAFMVSGNTLRLQFKTPTGGNASIGSGRVGVVLMYVGSVA